MYTLPADETAQLDPRGTRPILAFLRVSLHVLFAVLLAVGVVRTGLELQLGDHNLWMGVLLSALLGWVYFFGTYIEHRVAAGKRVPPVLAGFVSERGSYIWLALVLLLWVGLVLLHQDFVWLALPLYFLALHVMHRQPWIGYLLVGVSATVVAIGPILHRVPFSAAQLLGPMIGAGVAVIFWLIYRALYLQTQAQQQALQQLRRTQDELARSQRAAGRLAERERLAREIHDTLAQGFSSIVLCARAAQQTPEERELQRLLALIEESASTNLNEARSVIAGLESAETDINEFLTELTRLCEQTQALPGRGRRGGAQLHCRLVIDGEPYPLPSTLQQLVRRISQASLANIVQHAHASNAVLTVGFQPDRLTVDVYDDGVGMDTSADAGFGIRALRARVAEGGGTVNIESSPGKGTVVAIQLPRQHVAESDRVTVKRHQAATSTEDNGTAQEHTL